MFCVKLRWAYPDQESRDEMIQAVHQTMRSSQASIEADACNADLMLKLVGKRLDMVLIVEHDVMVSEGSKSRKKQPDRPLRAFTISVASVFCFRRALHCRTIQ